MRLHRLLNILSALVAALPLSGCDRAESFFTDRNPSVVSAKAEDGARLTAENLEKQATSGNVSAMIELAHRYSNGSGVPRNESKAFDWLLKAASANDVAAMGDVARRYQRGIGVAASERKYEEWLRRAAEVGGPAEHYRYARKRSSVTEGRVAFWGPKAELEHEVNEFLLWMRKSADARYPKALYEMGMAYLSGIDEKTASFFPDKSAKTSNTPSKQWLAIDQKKAIQLLSESASAGYWRAQWALATIYQAGMGEIAPNKETSEKFWNQLASQTDPNACLEIGRLYLERYKDIYKDGRNKYMGENLSYSRTNQVAVSWFQRALEANEGQAAFLLGEMYRDGIGVSKDTKTAIDYFRRGAETGHYRSQVALAKTYLSGEGNIRDYEAGRKWLLRSTADPQIDDSYFSDSAWALFALGAISETGHGVVQSNVAAYAWFNLSIAHGYDKAKDRLFSLERKLNAEELQIAQSLSRQWEPGKDLGQTGDPTAQPAQSDSGGSSRGQKLFGTGTGFFIDDAGILLTNSHVASDCKVIRVPAVNATAQLIVEDRLNDLVALRASATPAVSLVFAGDTDLSQGEEVFAFGFPLDGFLPHSGNITQGIVSALSGPGNNSSLIQMTAPLQPGNSGGPIFNRYGQVIGIAVAKANALKIARATGDIPQNVNFAIAPQVIKSFLRANSIQYRQTTRYWPFAESSVNIAEKARLASVKIECYK